MTWVKVCGLRRPDDVEAAVEAGADAIGFVLAESPRRVTTREARALGEDVPVVKVIVTVDLDPNSLLAAARATGADGVQPHGAHRREAAGSAAEAGLLVLHPVTVRGRVDLSAIPNDQIPLIDAHHPDLHGGAGRTFDWGLIPATERRFVLAGGLNPENVQAAVTEVRPWGVDASTGLESSPGHKDPELIRAFVEGAKSR